jgi:hypothetical protein
VYDFNSYHKALFAIENTLVQNSLILAPRRLLILHLHRDTKFDKVRLGIAQQEIFSSKNKMLRQKHQTFL